MRSFATNEEAASWLAGFIDGEGCVYSKLREAKNGKPYQGARVITVVNTDPALRGVGSGERGDRVSERVYPVKISAKSARLCFNGCEPEYIRTVCHASCCESSTAPNGTLITIHASEIESITARGGRVVAGFLQPRAGERRCPFKTPAHLCRLHETADKPFGCIASPFTLNANDTLIVRNRYKLLKCYRDGRRLPAYRAFRASLLLLFGAEATERIVLHLDGGGGDLMVPMPAAAYHRLKENDAAKHGRALEEGQKETISG